MEDKKNDTIFKNISWDDLANMDKQQKYDRAYLRMALEWAKLSHCKRKKVGALIVKNKMIISDGYNGTPSKFENCCEDDSGTTKWYVLHAEANAILKTASSTHNCNGGTLYLTMSPCKDCSKLIHQSGIKRLVFINKYKDTTGIQFLLKAGVEVLEFDKEKI
jgi:dCMP deaminase